VYAQIENVEQAKAVALYEFRKIFPYGIKVHMDAQRTSGIWIVRVVWGSPAREYEYRIDAESGKAWKIR